MYLLDTTFLVDLVKGQVDAVHKARDIDDSGQVACISVITVVEYLRGIHYLFGNDPKLLARKLAKAESDLARFEVIPINERIGRIAAKIWAEIKRAGRPIGLADVLIAATALRDDLTILTRNVQHFLRIRGLKIETY